jgi:NDP-sugar pyrophosphorylase family protein
VTLPVLILAGGLATRMRPVTKTIPKAMLDVNGKPFIHHQLNLLSRKNIHQILLCVGYLGEQIKDYVGDGRRFNLNVEYFFDGEKLLGTGGAIKKIEKNLPETFFVLYGDSYLNTDYQKVEDAYFASGKTALMTVFRNEGKWDASNVEFINGRIISYSKRNRTPNMNYIDWGLGILQKHAFTPFPSGVSFDLADVYEKLSFEGRLFGYEVFERFYEIGSISGLSDLQNRLT